MDFLDIGPLELLIILVVALLVFGPERIVEVGRSLGKMMRELRKATGELEKAVLEGKEEPTKKEKADEKRQELKPPETESGPR